MKFILRNIPKAVANIVYINIIMYLSVLAFRNYEIEDKLALYNPFFKEKFHFYQFFTHMFVHSKHFSHLLFNMMGLWMFGIQMEKIIGTTKFLKIYFSSALVASFLQLFFNLVLIYSITSIFDYNQIIANVSYFELDQSQIDRLRNSMFSPMVGSSGAVFGVVGAFARYFPSQKIFIFPIPFPIAVKKGLILCLILSILASLFDIFSHVAHFAHIGGIITGYLMGNYYLKKSKF